MAFGAVKGIYCKIVYCLMQCFLSSFSLLNVGVLLLWKTDGTDVTENLSNFILYSEPIAVSR